MGTEPALAFPKVNLTVRELYVKLTFRTSLPVAIRSSARGSLPRWETDTEPGRPRGKHFVGEQAAGRGTAEGSGVDAAPPGARGGGEGGDDAVLSGEGTGGRGRPHESSDGEREGTPPAKG